MLKKNKSLLIKAFSLLTYRDMNVSKYATVLKTLLSTRDDLSSREKSVVYKYFMNMYRTKLYDPEGSIKFMNHFERVTTVRYKKDKLKETMSYNREQRLPVVFYLCTYHEKAGKDHKDYQGKIYVDRYWKSSLLQGHGHGLGWLEEPIRSYIKNHGILTVQDVTNGKPYLITRPYCRHKLIPLNTWDVLTSSLSAIKRDHPEAVMGSGSKSKRQYKKEYNDLLTVLKTSIN
jgi:hypothetical protein